MGTIYRNKNRNGLDIIACILLISGKGATRTQIMYRANLSFKLLERYLTTVIALELVNIYEKNGRESYRTSHKGLRFLENYNALENIIRPDTQSTNESNKSLGSSIHSLDESRLVTTTTISNLATRKRAAPKRRSQRPLLERLAFLRSKLRNK